MLLESRRSTPVFNLKISDSDKEGVSVRHKFHNDSLVDEERDESEEDCLP
jgi:hypothetical protein